MRRFNLISVVFLLLIGSFFSLELGAMRKVRKEAAKVAGGAVPEAPAEDIKSVLEGGLGKGAEEAKDFLAGLKGSAMVEMAQIDEKRKSIERKKTKLEGDLKVLGDEKSELEIDKKNLKAEEEEMKPEEKVETNIVFLQWQRKEQETEKKLRKKKEEIEKKEREIEKKHGKLAGLVTQEIELKAEVSGKFKKGLKKYGARVFGVVAAAAVPTLSAGAYGIGEFDIDEEEESEGEAGEEVAKKAKTGLLDIVKGAAKEGAAAVGVKIPEEKPKPGKPAKKKIVAKKVSEVPDFLKIPEETEFTAEDAENYLKMVASYAVLALKKAKTAFKKGTEPVTLIIASGEKITVENPVEHSKKFLDKFSNAYSFFEKKRDAYKKLLEDRKELVKEKEGKEGTSLLVIEDKIKDLDEEIKTSKAIYKAAKEDAQEAHLKKVKEIKGKALFFKLPEEEYSVWGLSKIGVAQAKKCTKEFDKIDLAEIFDFLQKLEIPASDLLPVAKEATAKEEEDIEKELFEMEEEVEVKEPKSWFDKLKERGKEVAVATGEGYKEKAIGKVEAVKEKGKEAYEERREEAVGKVETVKGKAKDTYEERKEKVSEKVSEYREPTEEDEAERIEKESFEDAEAIKHATESEEGSVEWARAILDENENETLKNKIKSLKKIKAPSKRKMQFKRVIKGTVFAEGLFSDLSLEDEMKILQEAAE